MHDLVTWSRRIEWGMPDGSAIIRFVSRPFAVARSGRSRDRPIRARTLVPAALLLGVLVLGVTAEVAALTHEPLSVFTRDITVGAGVPPYVGAISLLNGMVWAATGVLALFVSYLEPVRRRWLIVFAGLTLVFAADDSLRLHESVGPAVGVPELAFFGVYAGAAVYLLVGKMARPFDEGTVVFVLGALLLGVSLAIDEIFAGLYFVEDAAKLLGALVWLTVPPLSLPAYLRSAADRPGSPSLGRRRRPVT